MTIPELVKQKRKELGETQEQFGKRFNTSAMCVSYWESGSRKPSYELLNFVLSGSKLQKGRTVEGRLQSIEAKVNEICEMLGLSAL